MNDYKELFKHMKPEGNRMLVKGDPGIGKTTFSHKLAYDWASGHLNNFELVLVIKLKFAEKDQSLESMIKLQIASLGECNISDEKLQKYLKSGQDRVLLVLDGLDEIQLKKFPQIHGMLKGEAYRKCSILATTRPYKAETLNNKMTVLAKIKGFSKQKAEEFISRILTDPKERNNFFLQLESRKMSDMHRIPIIVQAFALLYHENHDLPETYTLTYDELASFLRKTFESKNTENTETLNDEEIREAMEELNELAFRGLTREYRQLVFSRDEIRNENVFKLGLLTAEKTGSGFKPTTVLQFVHKTVQEHSAADHAVKRLLKNDRGPWETLLREHDNSLQEYDSMEKEMPKKQDFQDPVPVTDSKIGIIKSAIQKILDAFFLTA